MKRTLYILAPLLVALLGFYLWHTPMGGPLTDSEIEAFMVKQAEGGGSAWTDPEAFEAFLREDDGRPFVMINLMQVRDVAEYPEGYATEGKSGEDAEMAYGQSVLPLLLSRGSYPVARAERHHTIINSLGETAAQFESFAMVRYRSRRDLIDMISSDAFKAAGVHKWASLENTLVAPSRSGMSFQLIGYVPYMLIACIVIVLGRAVLRRN
ncbi:MAG: hypothetical protein AAGH53_05695 [Pseudomonadota bacterium]